MHDVFGDSLVSDAQEDLLNELAELEALEEEETLAAPVSATTTTKLPAAPTTVFNLPIAPTSPILVRFIL
jgi:hypothetical protein